MTLLSAAEEVMLARRIERGDLQAQQRMIESNVRLVHEPAPELIDSPNQWVLEPAQLSSSTVMASSSLLPALSGMQYRCS